MNIPPLTDKIDIIESMETVKILGRQVTLPVNSDKNPLIDKANI